MTEINKNETPLITVEDGAYSVSWDEEHQVVRVVSVGLADEEMAKGIRDGGYAITKQQGHPLNWICDLSRAQSATSEARVIFHEILTSPQVGQLVYFGGLRIIGILANSLLRLAGKKNGFYVKDEKSALALIKKNQKIFTKD